MFHEIILVNMNTLKLEVIRHSKDSLFTKDRMRVDVVVTFFVRVIPTVEGIANAARHWVSEPSIRARCRSWSKTSFVDALRAAAVSMTMQELLDKRQNFIQGVQNAASEDLLKNGLELESVSLTRIDQDCDAVFRPQQRLRRRGSDAPDGADTEACAGAQ